MMKPETKKALEALAKGWVVFDFPLADLTTYRLGGPADALVEPDSVEDLAAVLRFVKEHGLPWFVLSGGSNVLVRDGGFPGVVIRLGRSFSDLIVGPEESGRRLVEAGASARTHQLVALTRREGLTGLESLSGIPGWVGGALVMNAGTRDGAICDDAVYIDYVNADGELVRLERDAIKAGYRCLDVPPGAILIRAAFSLRVSDPDAVDATIRDMLEKRKASQPKGVRCAGCVFKNPTGDFAGRLVDQAGMKGMSAGKAWVSEIHANFIVHRGKASASQILELVETARKAVQEKFDVDLETEIVIVGVDLNGETE